MMSQLINRPLLSALAPCAAALLLAVGDAALAQASPAGSASDAQPARPDAIYAAQGHDEGIEGTWESGITLHDCRTGTALRTFKGLTVLHRGGSASATNNLPPSAGGPAYGTWRRASIAGTYEINLRFFRFNADGTWAGAQNLRRRVTQLDGNTLSGTLSAQVLDSAGNILQTVCGIEAATRVAAL